MRSYNIRKRFLKCASKIVPLFGYKAHSFSLMEKRLGHVNNHYFSDKIRHFLTLLTFHILQLISPKQFRQWRSKMIHSEIWIHTRPVTLTTTKYMSRHEKDALDSQTHFNWKVLSLLRVKWKVFILDRTTTWTVGEISITYVYCIFLSQFRLTSFRVSTAILLWEQLDHSSSRVDFCFFSRRLLISATWLFICCTLLLLLVSRSVCAICGTESTRMSFPCLVQISPSLSWTIGFSFSSKLFMIFTAPGHFEVYCYVILEA